MDAAYLYLVRFWIHPDSAAAMLHWLDAQHMQDVVSQPGFQWMRRVRLDQDAEDGWHAYMMIYAVESREALQRYFDSPVLARFAAERRPFQHHLRMERAWGAVDAAVG